MSLLLHRSICGDISLVNQAVDPERCDRHSQDNTVPRCKAYLFSTSDRWIPRTGMPTWGEVIASLLNLGSIERYYKPLWDG